MPSILRFNCKLLSLLSIPVVALIVAACDGPALTVPPPPTRDPSQPSISQNHQHGEGGGTGGRLITVYGGQLTSSVSTEPGVAQPGTPVAITYTLKDKSGTSVTPDRLQVTHDKLMHLIVVSKDLTEFAHIHPEYTGNGKYTATGNFPTAGDYLLFNEFFGSGGEMQLERNEISVAGDRASEVSPGLTPNLGQPQQVEGLTLMLNADSLKVRRRVPTHFTLSVSKEGSPVTTLEPYLGAPAHVVLISADTMQFAHTHADVPGGAMSGDMSSMNMAMPMATLAPDAHFGPNLQFTHTFMQPGLYGLWAQFGYEGHVITVGYNVQVNK
jgi:hypothetical protein